MKPMRAGTLFTVKKKPLFQSSIGLLFGFGLKRKTILALADFDMLSNLLTQSATGFDCQRT
jgi:hypothetical protein